jgi:hypothetical protein
MKGTSGAFGLYQTLGVNVVTYQDNAVVNAHWYYYYVTAFNAVGESAPSNQVSILSGSS